MGEQGITQKELEQYSKQIQEANDRVVSVLKDVAVQFNTIANQLMLLAKSNEDIIVTSKENHSVVITHTEKENKRLVEDLTTNCESCIAYISEVGTKLDSITTIVGESSKEINAEVSSLTKSVDKYTTERLKSSTIWIIVFGCITGSLALMTAALKFLTK
jgi:Fe2+ transport system protein B